MVSSTPVLTRLLASLMIAGALSGAATGIAQEDAPRGGEITEPEQDSQQAEPAADRPLAVPSDDPPTLRIPENIGEDPPPSNGEGRVPEAIRDAIRQRGDQRETGDAILDGVLDAIRRRGSVLDGSPLDPRQRDGDPLPQPELRPLPREGSGNGFAPPPGRRRGAATRPRSPIDAEGRFLLAEQLLKTARLLALRPDADPARRQLIDDLRAEAARVLAETRPPRSDGGPMPAGYGEPSRSY